MSWCIFTDAEMNGDKDVDLTFISFHHYKNTCSYYLHKPIPPEHGETHTSCMNIDNVDKEGLQHGKALYLHHAEFWIFIQNIKFHQLKNWIFNLPLVYTLGKIMVQVNRIKFL